MKFKITILFLCCFCSTILFAQSYSVKGIATDSINKLPIAQATLTLINAKDSTLVSFTRSTANGDLLLKNIPNGKYKYIVSRLSFVDVEDYIEVNNADVNLSKINLISKAKLLENVEVQQRIAAIRLKGDTLEYKADSFKVDKNATVQELLKRLPGISVNGKGEIVAQGQQVQKVLVDGEEFFSDDPAVVTKNLRADAIDKVQVFDKQSDQAAFTGIDDGVKNKTINLQMKEDKKKGYFGKLEAGSDLGDFRYGKAMANYFKGKQKIAAYLTADNTAYESLNWNEKSNYGEDMNRTVEMNEDGGMSMWSSGDDFSSGQGFPSSNTGGLHFSKKWNEDKNNLNNTYQYNQIGVYGGSKSINQTLINDSSSFINREDENFDSYKRRNKLRSSYSWKIDSTSDFKVVVTGSSINTLVGNNYVGNSTNNKNELLNQTERTTNSNAQESFVVGNINWRKRLKKKGRTISVSLDADVTNNKKTTSFQALNYFYSSGITTEQKIDQLKTDEEERLNLKSKLAYTEPLWKNTYLEINTSYAKNSNNATRSTFDKNPFVSPNYDIFLDSLSTKFNFISTSFFGGANFKYQNKKINFSIGSSVGNVNFKLEDKLRNDNRNVNFANWQPTANINYTPQKQRRFSLGYNGRNQNPNLLQIQPFTDNSNPLNITIGNPFLKQEFTHSFNFNFSDYKVLKSKNIYISANYSFTNNAITNSNTIDAKTGQNINQAINVNGNTNFNMWANYGFEMFQSLNVNFQFNPTINKFVNVVNGVTNENKSANWNFSVGSGYWGEKWINYWFDFGPTYNTSSSSINKNETKFWNWRGSYDINLKWKKQKIGLYLSGEARLFQKTNTFNNNANVLVLNAYIKKALDKDEKWEFQIGVHDLLNQNQNINRSIMSNFISENIRQTIQRFGMISFTYNFSKNGKPTSHGW
jgi:hypothetical protein